MHVIMCIVKHRHILVRATVYPRCVSLRGFSPVLSRLGSSRVTGRKKSCCFTPRAGPAGTQRLPSAVRPRVRVGGDRHRARTAVAGLRQGSGRAGPSAYRGHCAHGVGTFPAALSTFPVGNFFRGAHHPAPPPCKSLPLEPGPSFDRFSFSMASTGCRHGATARPDLDKIDQLSRCSSYKMCSYVLC